MLVTFLLFGIWALCLISADENNFVPSWARISGQGAAYLIIVAQIGILFGLIPAAGFVPLFLLGGVNELIIFFDSTKTQKRACCFALKHYHYKL